MRSSFGTQCARVVAASASEWKGGVHSLAFAATEKPVKWLDHAIQPISRIFDALNRHTSMTTTHHSVGSDYASGYGRGRHAAKEHVSADENPFHPRTPAHRGWNDGYYDEQSARAMAIGRHSASIWESEPGRS